MCINSNFLVYWTLIDLNSTMDSSWSLVCTNPRSFLMKLNSDMYERLLVKLGWTAVHLRTMGYYCFKLLWCVPQAKFSSTSEQFKQMLFFWFLNPEIMCFYFKPNPKPLKTLLYQMRWTLSATSGTVSEAYVRNLTLILESVRCHTL